jgi:transcription elongation factor Elf1
MTGQISAQRRRWIEAAKVLAADPKASVACPKCGQGILQVIDARQDDVKLDRYMQCLVCHANNVMTLIDPVK